MFADDPPDPAGATTAAEFIERLAELRRWAGQPSLRELRRLAQRADPAHGDALPPTTVSWILNGNGLPGLPKIAFVDAFVSACLGARARPSAELRDELWRWRNAWRDAAAGGETGAAGRHQLPMDITEFTGRHRELAELHHLAGSAAGPPVVAIEGMAGVGKTRLAVHFAHQVIATGRYDQVQLWADLRGFDPARPAADPMVLLDTFLRQLGVPPSRIPDDPEARAALYRDQLAGRHALVLLDNAAGEAQVRLLLPGEPRCLTLITTRRSFTDLPGIRSVRLGVFSAEEATDLVAGIVGAERTSADADATATLVARCGRLPLALGLAARRLRNRPSWGVRDLVARLDNSAAQAGFALSYRELPPGTRRVFRLLALHPGDEYTAASVAALADIGTAAADAALESLLDDHLLQQDTPGRYRCHDLLREFARDRAEAEETPEARRAAVLGVLDWYLQTAHLAGGMLEPGRRRPGQPGPPRRPPPHFRDRASALVWCEAERATLVAAVDAAVAHGALDVAWQLPAELLGFFYLRSHWHDWIATHRTGLAAAREAGATRGQALLLRGLGVAYSDLRRFDDAFDCYDRALALCTGLGDEYGRAWVLNNLGVACLDLDRLTEAAGYLSDALAAFRLAADEHGEGVCLNNLGDALRRLGRSSAAAEHLRQAIDLQRSAHDQAAQRYTLGSLGALYQDGGHHREALRAYRQAWQLSRELGDQWGTARFLDRISASLDALGRCAAARECRRRSAVLLTELGAPASLR
jgi:tetratricopeptide (TPR) repeat protein